jgi:regulatory protein
MPQATVDNAFAELLRRTSQRPQTEAEITAVLARRYDEETVAAAVRRGRSAGAVDDEAFARAWVDDRGHKRGYGFARLRDELRRRQVPEPLIEQALEGLSERDDLATATELARKRASSFPASLDPPAVARRLAGFLARRGYGPSLAQKVAVDVSGLDRYRSWD